MHSPRKSKTSRLVAFLLLLLAIAIAVSIVRSGKCREEPVPTGPKDPPPTDPGVPVTPPAPPLVPPVAGSTK